MSLSVSPNGSKSTKRHDHRRRRKSADELSSLYEMLYRLAANEGREQVLFGDCAPLAHEAFVRSLVGDGFSYLWYELPMLGKPRFDLHVAFSRDCLGDGSFFPGAGNGYDELFRWYANEESGGQGLAFAYDVGDGAIDNPAVHVNVNGAPLGDMDRFFALAGTSDAGARCRAFADRMPDGWTMWYTGVHPGRPGAPVRIDCFVNSQLKEAYAADLGLFERDLRRCGFTAGLDALPDLAGALLSSPFALELQFDILEGGEVGPTLGLSGSFGVMAATQARPLFDEGGSIAELMSRVEALGLADSRWHAVRGALYSLVVPVPDSDHDVIAFCLPAFLKLRMREGRGIDVKVYLQATAI